MTIDEAIEHAEWCAENSCGECADDHRQLAEWLRELKDLRRKREILKAHGVEIVDAVAGGYEVYNEAQRTIDRLKGENEKLRELVKDYDKVLSSMHVLCDCDFVPLNDAVLLALRSRMHELGIEVD